MKTDKHGQEVLQHQSTETKHHEGKIHHSKMSASSFIVLFALIVGLVLLGGNLMGT